MAPIRTADSIRIAGMSQFRRELKKLDDGKALSGELKDANIAVAKDVILWARSKAATQGKMAAKAASSLRAGRTQTRAQVSFGGRGFEFAAGSEFGADRNLWRIVGGRQIKTRQKQYETRLVDSSFYGKQVRRRVRIDDAVSVRTTASRRVKGWNQFRTWRGNREGAGYWLFPSIRSHSDEIVDRYGDTIERVAAKAFPN